MLLVKLIFKFFFDLKTFLNITISDWICLYFVIIVLLKIFSNVQIIFCALLTLDLSSVEVTKIHLHLKNAVSRLKSSSSIVQESV